MANSFEARENVHLHNRKDQPVDPAPVQAGETILGIPQKKPNNRKAHTLYLDVDLMNQMKSLAKRQGVSFSVMVEAALRNALEQIDG